MSLTHNLIIKLYCLWLNAFRFYKVFCNGPYKNFHWSFRPLLMEIRCELKKKSSNLHPIHLCKRQSEFFEKIEIISGKDEAVPYRLRLIVLHLHFPSFESFHQLDPLFGTDNRNVYFIVHSNRQIRGCKKSGKRKMKKLRGILCGQDPTAIEEWENPSAHTGNLCLCCASISDFWLLHICRFYDRLLLSTICICITSREYSVNTDLSRFILL